MLKNYQSQIFIQDDCEYAKNIVKTFFPKLNIKMKSFQDFKSAVKEYEPDLIVLDRLNNSASFVESIKKTSKVISFEDLGTGALLTDITFNEIYNKPVFKSDNIHWGPNSFLIRDAFRILPKNKFRKRVKDILITFGGIDPRNLSLFILRILFDYFDQLKSINFHLILGPGYPFSMTHLNKFQSIENLHIYPASKDIASIMSKCDIGICSNGRTVFELAHLSIPSIVIPQHEREANHDFPDESKGFIKLGFNSEVHTKKAFLKALFKLLDNQNRKRLYHNMKEISFSNNKKYIKEKIYEKI